MDFNFEPNGPVALSICELLPWIVDSLTPAPKSPTPLTLPPLQRNGTWRPKQVLDLWRSVLEGMPIGLFYLQPAGEEVVDPSCRTRLMCAPPGALDLFDGQQRVRALALGAGDPFGEERCIWVKFKVDGYDLILSSRTQPAGYRDDGGKRSVGERRGERALFSGSANDSTFPLEFPFGCSSIDTMRLKDLLAPHLAGGTTGDLTVTGSGLEAGRRDWQRDCAWLSQPCAVFMRLPDKSFDHPTKMLNLFRRVGAGGTPLSQDEQVYSAYKWRYPGFRDAVETTSQKVSAVLTPAQIIQAALRMAYIEKDTGTGWIPGPGIVIPALEAGDMEIEKKLGKLNRLLKRSEGDPLLTRAFESVRKTLEYLEGSGAFYLPEIVMAHLPQELWQVLAFWFVRAGHGHCNSRKEIVRFALAWHLAVTHNERAVQKCFRSLVISSPATFPGKELFGLLVSEGHAYRIAKPCELDSFFRRAKQDEETWLRHEKRFPPGELHREIADTWWFSRKMLPWLQREYLRKDRFKHYRPLSDHEDDLPYDWDHICAQAHWGPDGRSVDFKAMSFVTKQDQEASMAQPWVTGNALGNMRLVDFSQNRSDGDAQITVKMPFLASGEQATDLGTAGDFLVDDSDERVLWQAVDAAAGTKWQPPRRKAFQEVVERRTARLYSSFYNDLEFKDWEQVL